MTIIDPFYLYLILQLDSIKGFIVFLGALSLAALCIFCLALLIRGASAKDLAQAYAGDDSALYKRRFAEETATAETSFRILNRAIRFLPAPLFLLALDAALPTSERMAVLVVLPAIANNETIQTEAKEVYDLAKRGLSSLIEAAPEEVKEPEAKE